MVWKSTCTDFFLASTVGKEMMGGHFVDLQPLLVRSHNIIYFCSNFKVQVRFLSQQGCILSCWNIYSSSFPLSVFGLYAAYTESCYSLSFELPSGIRASGILIRNIYWKLCPCSSNNYGCCKNFPLRWFEFTY